MFSLCVIVLWHKPKLAKISKRAKAVNSASRSSLVLDPFIRFVGEVEDNSIQTTLTLGEVCVSWDLLV